MTHLCYTANLHKESSSHILLPPRIVALGTKRSHSQEMAESHFRCWAVFWAWTCSVVTAFSLTSGRTTRCHVPPYGKTHRLETSLVNIIHAGYDHASKSDFRCPGNRERELSWPSGTGAISPIQNMGTLYSTSAFGAFTKWIIKEKISVRWRNLGDRAANCQR